MRLIKGFGADIFLGRALFLSDDPVSSQLFAICSVVFTYRRASSLILQSDGQEAPLSESARASSESACMLKFQVRRWSERPRMLVFMLGVMLPAAAFIVAGAWHLTNIQRDKAIEAVFQREFQQVLAIAEKRIDARAYEITEEARAKFPDANQGDELEAFLTSHRDIAHAFLWTGKGHVDSQSQPARMSDPEFVEEGKKFSAMIGPWFDLESKDLITKLKKSEVT